jgi:hypothetical protein
MEAMMKEAIKTARPKRKNKNRREKFFKYQDDPVGFGEKVLGEYYTDDIKRVMESVRDNPVTIAKSANGVGKTHSAARIAIWFYKCFPDSQVYTTAAPPYRNLQTLLWGEIMSVVEKHKDKVLPYDRLRNLHISMGAKHFITGVAIPTSGTSKEREAKFSGKHAPYLLFIVDEGDAVPDEIYDAIESCMSGGEFRLLIMFNPRFKGGPVYYKEKRNLANVITLSAFDHPNVITGKDVIPGAVNQVTTIRRIHNWSRPLHPNEKVEADCFEVPEFLVGKEVTGLDGIIKPPLQAGFRKIEQPELSYMVLADYPAQSEMQLISQTWIDKARSNYDLYVAKFGELPPENVQPVLGVDIAELGIDYNTACLRYGSYVAPLKAWNGIDPDDSATKTYTLYVENNAKIAMVDGTGVGAGVAPRVARIGREENRDDVRTVSVKSASAPSRVIKVEEGEFYMLRDQLWWSVREWLKNDPNAMLPNDPFLLEELAAPTYKKDLRGKIRVTDKDTLRDVLRRSTDRADALCLTFAPFERAKVIGINI